MKDVSENDVQELSPQEEYRQNIQKMVEEGQRKYDTLKAVLGPKGKLYEGTPLKKEYDEIEVDVPEGLTEEQVTAIIIGAMMQPDRLDGPLTGSSFPPGTTTFWEFNQNFIVENLVKQNEVKRVQNLSNVIVQARKDAQEAIRAYQNGDMEPVKQMLNNYVDYAMRDAAQRTYNTGSLKPELLYSNVKKGVMLAGEMTGEEPFGVTGTVSEVKRLRATAESKQISLLENAVGIKQKLLTEPSAPGSEERENQVAEMLFAEYIAGMSETVASERFIRTETEAAMLFQRLHDKTFPDEPAHKLRQEQRAVQGVADLKSAIEENEITDFEAFLAQPDGVEKLKALYMEEIKKTDTYQKLVNAEGDELTDAMMAADKEAAKGITSFASVELEPLAQPVNERARAQFDQAVQKIEDKVTGLINENHYGFMALKTAQLEDNTKMLKGLEKDLKDHTNWRGSSKNYDNAVKAIQALAEYSEKLENAGLTPTAEQAEQYILLAREAERLSGLYIEQKTNINGPYAQGRVDTMKEVRRKLQINVKSMEGQLEILERAEVDRINEDNKQKEKEFKAYEQRRENERKYSSSEESVRMAYSGGRPHSEFAKKGKQGSYSIDRSALYSITLVALAAEKTKDGKTKYTFEQLTDPNSIKEERTKMFDEVWKNIQLAAKPGPEGKEASKWLAKVMYEGQQVTQRMMDEKMYELDLTDPNFTNTDLFARMMAVGHANFDIGQEVAHCEKEILDLVKEDHPEIKDIASYQKYVSDHDGPIGDIWQAHAHLESVEAAYQICRAEGKRFENAAGFVSDALKFQTQKNILIAWGKEKNKVPFSEWFIASGMNEASYQLTSAPKKECAMKLSDLGEKRNEALFRDLHDDILNGNFMSDAKFIFDPQNPAEMHFEGVPDIAQVKADYDARNMPEEQVREQCASVYQSYKKKLGMRNGALDTYITDAMNKVGTLSDQMINGAILNENEKRNIRSAIDNIAAVKWAETLHGMGLTDQALGAAVRTAMEADDSYRHDLDHVGYDTMRRYALQGAADHLVENAPEALKKARQAGALYQFRVDFYDDKLPDKDRLEYMAETRKDMSALKTLLKDDFLQKTSKELFDRNPGRKKCVFTDAEKRELQQRMDRYEKEVLNVLFDGSEKQPEKKQALADLYRSGALTGGITGDAGSGRFEIHGVDAVKQQIQEREAVIAASQQKEQAKPEVQQKEQAKPEVQQKEQAKPEAQQKEQAKPEVQQPQKVSPTQKFMEAAEKAMERLENPAYKSRKAYVADAAMVVTGKIYEQTGKLPVGKESGKPMELAEYAEQLKASPSFAQSLMCKKDPTKMMNPKAFAKSMQNPQVVNQMVRQSAQMMNAPQQPRRNSVAERPAMEQGQQTRKRSNTVAGPTR